MHCPFCHAIDTKVIDSRLFDDGAQVRRRRECISCMGRFTTFEKVELSLRVIKRSGLHVLFDPEKLRTGLLKALEKRPVTVEQIDVVMSRILRKIQATGDREISSQLIGEFVMDELRPLDEVAYVRFASVYLSFQHINAFREEIQKYQEWANREKKE